MRTLLHEARRGQRLRDGLHVVIVGPPNVGKSSLLNALAGSDRSIVTELAGTTRDVVREVVRIDGIEITLVDTAGLRDSADPIEREGIRRAHQELVKADLALIVSDARETSTTDLPEYAPEQRLYLHNKCDLAGHAAGQEAGRDKHIWLSALRSEEHTSELQSLMRISYAVFCLKKKKQQTKITLEQSHSETS